MPLKKNTPGCPCCTPTGCDVTFVITACCGPAVGATITVKDGSGTTKGTGTTNSSGSVTINLAGTSGTTLYVTVSYDATHYDQYTSVILGNHCGRTYAYTLTPKTETYGGGCGTVTVRTLQCDNSTPYGSVPVSLRLTGSGTLVASGTTDATTGIYTFTGVSTGVSYTVVGTSSRGELIASGSFTLACNEDVRLRYSTTYPPGCSSPNYTLTAVSAGGTTLSRACCTSCGATTIPGRLILDSWPDIAAYTSYMGAATFTGAVTYPTNLNGSTSACSSMWWPETNVGGTVVLPWGPTPNYFPWRSLGNLGPILWCNGSTFFIRLWYFVCVPVCGGYNASASGGWRAGQAYQDVAASSVTCTPFAATFNVPAFTPTLISSDPFAPRSCTSGPTFPAATVTIHE